jgi:hypothetical protein
MSGFVPSTNSLLISSLLLIGLFVSFPRSQCDWSTGFYSQSFLSKVPPCDPGCYSGSNLSNRAGIRAGSCKYGNTSSSKLHLSNLVFNRTSGKKKFKFHTRCVHSYRRRFRKIMSYRCRTGFSLAKLKVSVTLSSSSTARHSAKYW